MRNNQAKKSRKAGVLLHISSLPSANFGEDAFKFVDFLAGIGASVWQVLPLNMPHDDGSPYQCLSAHAGNPAFISLQKLVDEQWIAADEAQLGATQVVAIAYNRFYKQLDDQSAFACFCRRHAHWLNDFALFLALRNHFNHAGWFDWPSAYKNRESKALKQFKSDFSTEIALIKFTQFIYFNQWSSLKKYAYFNKVKLFGDVPIFVAYDSADVWANRALFKLNKRGKMTVVAGVPPDYFSETGQHWGNPHYNWQAMRQDGFKWWLARMRTQKQLFDIVRIDHFRGLEAAWEIPARDETAINGQWRRAPGKALLKAITEKFPNMQLVAEDLGIITPKVDALRQQYKLPGMKILQFAFGGDDNNPYLPHNIPENSVAYTGTHDNDTTLGWYQSLDENAKNHVHRVLESSEPAMPQALTALVLSCQASLAIIPMQDILGLDATHRMNTPGTVAGNWQWRFTWDMLSVDVRDSIKSAIEQSNRQLQ
jgi:4-alpha-glucanotransferase